MAEGTGKVTVTESVTELMKTALSADYHYQEGSDEGLSSLIQLGISVKKYGIPPVAITGLLCNFLILWLMRRSCMQTTTSAIYFSSLAIVDNLHLLHNLLADWYIATFKVDPYSFYDITCKLKSFLAMFSSNSPAWLVIALTTERVAITTFPLRARQWCTRRAALVLSVATLLFIAALWLVLIFMWGVSGGPCDKNSDSRRFMLEHGYLLGIVLYTLIPSPLLIVLNGVLIYQVVKGKILRKKMLTSGAAAGRQSQSHKASLSRITVMAVVVSLTYVVLTLPALTFTYINIVVNKLEVKGTMAEPLWRFLHDASVILRELNHSINLFLYLLVLPKVRTELAALVLCCRHPKEEENTGRVSTVNKASLRLEHRESQLHLWQTSH